jgi:O-antigen ligase
VLLLFALAIPLDTLPLFGASSIAWFSGILLAGAGLWHIVTTGKLRDAPAALLVLTAFTAWALASVLWAYDTRVALERFATAAQLLLALWLAWQLAPSRAELGLLAGGFVAGCFVAAAGAWRAFLTGTNFTQVNPEWAGYQGTRYTALGYDPNDMGVTMAIGLPMAAYLMVRASGGVRWLWFAYLPVGLGAIVLSGSRGAMMTAAAALPCVLLSVSKRSRTALLLIIAASVAVVVTLAVQSPDTFERIFTIRQQLVSGTMSERATIWSAGLDLFLRDPVAGAGIGQFAIAVTPVLGWSIEAHNAFVSVMVELGVVGLLLFTGAFAVLAHTAWKAEGAERAFALALLVTWVVGVSSLTWELRKTTWFVALLCAAVGQLPRLRAGDAAR